MPRDQVKDDNHMTETRYQRIAREQVERQAAQAAKRDAVFKAEQAAIRKQRKAMREGRKEGAYLNVITGNHDHSMNS